MDCIVWQRKSAFSLKFASLGALHLITGKTFGGEKSEDDLTHLLHIYGLRQRICLKIVQRAIAHVFANFEVT